MGWTAKLMGGTAKLTCALLALALPGFCACYNDHPSDDINFRCDLDPDSCPPGEVCVQAGAYKVCSSTTGCPGVCGEGFACVDGVCKCFKLDCTGRECGDDLCGGSCGSCPSGDNWLCIEGQCEGDCLGRECGESPVLGVICGSCPSGDNWLCIEGQCEDDCAGRECGESEHGITCGSCTGTDVCSADGKCVWQPDEYTVSCSDGMCLIPAGSFWMGCNEAVDTHCQNDESPYHEVTLSGFYMDKTEVTQGEYKKCVDAEVCDTPDCYWDPTGTPDRPVVCLKWTQAGEYCTWAGKRLPTEAEWEKAARGTDGRKYPWGNETATCDYAVMYDGSEWACGTGETWDVCEKSPAGDSPYGLCDMSGNVWEWVSDLYDPDYYTNSPSSNPTNTDSGSDRVVRGGGFASNDDDLRASNRSHDNPSDYDDFLGFRCARPQ